MLIIRHIDGSILVAGARRRPAGARPYTAGVLYCVAPDVGPLIREAKSVNSS